MKDSCKTEAQAWEGLSKGVAASSPKNSRGPWRLQATGGFQGQRPGVEPGVRGEQVGPRPLHSKVGGGCPTPFPLSYPQVFLFLIQTNENQICNHTRFISLGLNYLCNTKNRFVKEYDTDTADKILIPSRCWQRYERRIF